MSEPKNLTPAHLRCTYGASCPTIRRLEDGRLLVVGKRDVDCLYLHKVAIGDDEQAVIISPDLLDSVKAEWVRDAIGKAASGVTNDLIRQLRRTPLYDSTGNSADELADAIADALEASQAEVERLREALTPFAKEAGQWAAIHGDEHRPLCDTGGSACDFCGKTSDYVHAQFTVGDLRRAAALSSPVQKDKEPQP